MYNFPIESFAYVPICVNPRLPVVRQVARIEIEAKKTLLSMTSNKVESYAKKDGCG